jgi:hypothetical protein
LPRAWTEAGRETGDREVDHEADPCIMALSDRENTRGSMHILEMSTHAGERL